MYWHVSRIHSPCESHTEPAWTPSDPSTHLEKEANTRSVIWWMDAVSLSMSLARAFMLCCCLAVRGALTARS